MRNSDLVIKISISLRYNKFNGSIPDAVFRKWRCICRDAVERKGYGGKRHDRESPESVQ